MIGGYADQAAHEAHLSTPHLLKYKTGTAEMVRSLEMIETGPDHHSKRKTGVQADHDQAASHEIAGARSLKARVRTLGLEVPTSFPDHEMITPTATTVIQNANNGTRIHFP